MRLTSHLALMLLSLGVAGYALVVYGLLPLGIGLHPDMRAAFEAQRIGIYAHVFAAVFTLVLGPFQFSTRLRAARPRLHRWMGRTYVLACMIAGAAGLLLAFGATTGPVSTAGFGLLAVLWLFTTTKAWTSAMNRRFDEHRRWMIRSFALTFAAVTLRLYLPLAFFSPWGYDDTYRAISFLCWVPNLLFAEVFVRVRARM